MKGFSMFIGMLFVVALSSVFGQSGGWNSVDQISTGWTSAVALSLITNDGASGGSSSLNIHVEGTSDQAGTIMFEIHKDAAPVAIPLAGGAYVKWVSGNSTGRMTLSLNLTSSAEFSAVSGRDTTIPYQNLWASFLVGVPDTSGNPTQIDGVSLVFKITGLQSNQAISMDIRIDNVYFQYDFNGNVLLWDGMGDLTMSIKEYTGVREYDLAQNYPNPFNPATTIKYHLTKSEKVRLEIFNIAGELVKTLLNAEMPAGEHEIVFDGQGLSSGVYFYRIQAGSFVDIKKMNLLK